MDYSKEIFHLKEKIKGNDPDDFDKNTQYFREIKNELLMRRSQVIQLKKEVDEANLKIFELNKSLEINKSTLKETEFNLKLALKKSSSIEEKLKGLEESHAKMRLKEEMKASEIHILNENMQKLARDKHQLSHEIDDLKNKLKFYSNFQNDLENWQTKIKATITKMRADTEKLEREHFNVMEMGKRIQCTEEFKNLSFTVAKHEKSRKAYQDLENKFIEISAKYDKLLGVIGNSKISPDLIAKIKFLQWENRYKDARQQIVENEKMIKTLYDSLNHEIEINGNLILQNDEYKIRIAELEKQLEDNKMNVKEEKLN